MDFKDRIVELRESTGMTREEFCEYFHIPYRTVTEWERDNRHAPEYVLRLLEYYIRMEGLIKDKTAEVQEGPSERRTPDDQKDTKMLYLYACLDGDSGRWLQPGSSEG